MRFDGMLAAWLPRQRWFGGKGRAIAGLAVVADTELVHGDPGMHHVIVTLSQGGVTSNYQVLIGLRAQLPGWLDHAAIGTDGHLRAYDALHDPALTRQLLHSIVAEQSTGPLRFSRIPGAVIETGRDSLVLTGEQSNTSLVFGEEAILKVFRGISPGPNPDLEVTAALARLGSPRVAPPLGWIETRMNGATTILAILSRYLRAAADGWSLAATSVRDLYASEAASAAEAGGDFAGEARRLGVTTAQVHRDLAKAFGTDGLSGDATAELAGQMDQRLTQAISAVPALGAYAGMIGAAYTRLAALPGPVPVQRVHGDYHLGQVMRTQAGWVVLDFEGEPVKSLAERRTRSSPLRDMAGMLRSLDYAARCQLHAHPGRERLAGAAREWIRRNSAAFCDGYADAGGAGPAGSGVLLRALQLDKAVYEVMYEVRNRPSWLPIPLESLADIQNGNLTESR